MNKKIEDSYVVDSIVVKKDITYTDAINLFVTALEGGIGYWCAVDADEELIESIKTDYDYAYSEAVGHLVMHDNKSFKIIDDETDFEYVVTKQHITKGLALYLSSEWYTGRQIDDFDAYDADCVFQFATFGELMYS